MATSTDVTLYRDAEPTFPDVCVVCLGKPDRLVAFVNPKSGFWSSTLMPLLALFGWARYRAPACGPCARTFRLQRWGRLALMVLLFVIAMPFIKEFTADIEPKLVRKLAVAGLALAAMIPLGIFEVLRPRYVDTSPRGDVVDWEFRSAEYAEAFRQHNRGAVVRERS